MNRFFLWFPIATVLALGALPSLTAQDASFFERETIPFEEPIEGLSQSARRDAFWLQRSAARALEVGLYDLSVEFSRQAIELLGDDPSSAEVRLLAVDGLLARNDWIEATRYLDELEMASSVNSSSLGLRRVMIAFAEENVEAVGLGLAGVDRAALSEQEVPWREFLSGWVMLRRGERGFEDVFAEALRLGRQSSPSLSAQLGFLIFKSRLASRTVDSETIAQLQNAVLENRGREIGFVYAQQLAVSLYDSGDREAAVSLIDEQLLLVPAELGLIRAQFRLLQSMAAGLGQPRGRQAFQDLIAGGAYPDLMTIALQQAFSDVRLGESGDPQFFRQTLDSLIVPGGSHQLYDQALYYRAVFKFLDNDFVGAERDAGLFQDRFPNSSFRRGMLALQASSAWNRKRYRTAASYLQQLRSGFPDLTGSSTLAALVGDCYLRAGLQSNTMEDFRNAAESYATALSGVADPAQGGPIFYQFILARIRSGQVQLALDALDDPTLRALGGDEMIWRSEWIVMKEMRRLGRMVDAYDRIEVIVARAIPDPLLRLRLYWMAVKLSIDSDQPEDTEYWVDSVSAFIEENAGAIGDEELIAKIKGSCLLALAESSAMLGEAEDAVAILQRLREEYAGYESSLLSYIAEARYYSGINRTVEAQQLLVSLADGFPDHRLAPVALFEAAQNAERRGEDAFLDQANKLLERIATQYPNSEIVYYARLKQADLLRKLNKFGSAEQIYVFLENEYANRPDRFLAQLSLADTLLAQSNENPSKFEAAVSRLELLMDLPEAPLDLRVEAGYKLGQAWRVRGERLKAKQTYWLFYDLTIVDEPRIRTLGRNGIYWLSRCLFALAEISKEEGDWDRSLEFYEQIVQYRLPGEVLAKARLDAMLSSKSN